MLHEHDIALENLLTIDLNKIYIVSKRKGDGLEFHEMCGFQNLGMEESFRTIFFKSCLWLIGVWYLRDQSYEPIRVNDRKVKGSDRTRDLKVESSEEVRTWDLKVSNFDETRNHDKKKFKKSREFNI